MIKAKYIIRKATPGDAGKILSVYAPYVKETAITFEYDVPSEEEFRERIKNTLQRYPFIVAEQENEIVGYSYTGAFKERRAYDWAVETSIYLKAGARGCGIGRSLYQVLENVSRAQNIINMNACIGYPETEDEYLTKNSAEFHKHIGYNLVGEFHRCGFKFGRWYNMVWMEKMLGEHSQTPGELIPFPLLDDKTLKSCGLS